MAAALRADARRNGRDPRAAPQGSEGRHDLIRALLCSALFAGSFAAVLGLVVRALDADGLPPPTVDLNLMEHVEPQLDALRAGREGEAAPRIAFLGDSISISPNGGVEPVPRQLRRALAARRPAGAPVPRVYPLAVLGMGPFDYCFLADEIADARPDAVVIALSLNSFGETFRSISRKRVSGWIGVERLLAAARLPLYWIGLTYDEVVKNVAIVSLGGGPLWRALAVEQARFGDARDELASWLSSGSGGTGGGHRLLRMATYASLRKRSYLPGRDRYDGPAERRHYGAVLRRLPADHPMLAALECALAPFARREIPVLVYVNPINVEHLAAVGVLEDGVLEQSLRTIARAARRHGAKFLDLHARLPQDASFRDAAGHFQAQPGTDPTAEVARAVGPVVATQLRFRQWNQWRPGEARQNWK